MGASNTILVVYLSAIALIASTFIALVQVIKWSAKAQHQRQALEGLQKANAKQRQLNRTQFWIDYSDHMSIRWAIVAVVMLVLTIGALIVAYNLATGP